MRRTVHHSPASPVCHLHLWEPCHSPAQEECLQCLLHLWWAQWATWGQWDLWVAWGLWVPWATWGLWVPWATWGLWETWGKCDPDSDSSISLLLHCVFWFFLVYFTVCILIHVSGIWIYVVLYSASCCMSICLAWQKLLTLDITLKLVNQILWL